MRNRTAGLALVAALILAVAGPSAASAANTIVCWKVIASQPCIRTLVGDTEAGLPSSGVPEGFPAWAKDTDRLVCYYAGSWQPCNDGGGGGGDSFVTLNAPAGTDPVAESSTDTLNLTCSGGITCTGDSATDTLDIVGPGAGDPTLAGDVDGLGSANDLDEASVEVELEAVLDLADLQGAVTDAQVPNSITVDLATAASTATSATTATTATTAEAGDTATAFFPAGTFEDALVDGSLEADEVNPTLGTQTQGDYVASATVGQGLLLTGTEGGSLGLGDCAAVEVWQRNAEDTAWECAAVGGGSGLTHPQIMARLAVGGGY